MAFAYLEHIAANGEDVAVEVEAVDGQIITVCEAKDMRTQMLAYRERAQVSRKIGGSRDVRAEDYPIARFIV